MASDFTQARQQAMDVKALLRDGQLQQAISSAAQALQAVYASPLSKGEVADLRRILEKVVYMLNFDPAFRKVCPEGILYAQGEEKRLVQELESFEARAQGAREAMLAAERAAGEEKRREILDKGRELLDSGEAKKAVIFLRKSAKEHAHDPDFIMNLGQLLFGAKLFSEAYDIYELAYKVRSEDVVLLNLMGSCLRQIGKFDFASRLFSQALDMDPENHALLFNAARNAIDGHKWQQAYDLLKAALAVKPDFEQAQKALKAVERKIFGH